MTAGNVVSRHYDSLLVKVRAVFLPLHLSNNTVQQAARHSRFENGVQSQAVQQMAFSPCGKVSFEFVVWLKQNSVVEAKHRQPLLVAEHSAQPSLQYETYHTHNSPILTQRKS